MKENRKLDKWCLVNDDLWMRLFQHPWHKVSASIRASAILNAALLEGLAHTQKAV